VPNDKLQSQLCQIRTLVQDLGWGEFMNHVASIMAEQADKTKGEQSTALATCATTLHALQEAWQKCGKFQYPPEIGETSPNQTPPRETT
jgi:hypothetical protein